MRRIGWRTAGVIVCCQTTLLFGVARAATHTAASCSRADVQAAVDAASDGDTVLIPNGTATWTSGVTVNKGIHLKGSGGGRVEGSSSSSLAIGTGSKSFSIRPGSVVSAGFTVGETVRAVYKARGANYMEGTVAAWDGANLTLNVTSTGGSGTYAAWTFVVAAGTTIRTGAQIVLFTLHENAGHHVELSDLHLIESADALSLVECFPTAGGRQLLLHDIRYTIDYCAAFDFRMNGAVLWHIYGDAGFDFAKGTVFGVVRIKYNGAAGAWNALNSMGAADVDGDKNLYVESSYFCGLGSTDWDDNARGVFRHNVLDNASAMSHGADTSYIGGMHVEYYDNLCIFDNLGDDTINAQCFFESRGGTGIIADNTIPDIASSAWGNKPEIKLQIQVLDRNAGLFGLWGQGVAGAQYPAPRQVGMGHANSGYTNHSVTFAHPNADLASGLDNNSPPIYLGDLCPWYQWGNTGGGNLAAPGIMMSGYNQGTPDDPADYIQVGRDWINGVKPGYAKYTWPHPLRNDALPPLPEGPGLAAAYPTDAGIAGHADVIFADDFESYGAASELTTHWDEAYHLQNTRIATESNKVFAGSKALEFSVPVQTSETSNTAIKHLDPTEDVLFLRCYTKFDPGFLTYSSSHNGLGIQANYSGPGIPADGTNKFYVGLENSGTSEPPPGPTHLYVYHPEQRDIWGDHWYPDGRVVPFDYLPGDYGPDFVPRPNFTPERDRWYCIELMVKANTPGERDGRVAYWIDGNLAADFPNIRLRDVDTLKIDKFHIGLHINGATTRVNTKWYDNVVAARSYIGPMAGGTPDETPPTVALSAPAGGATVSNTVTVSATASDNVGVVGVQFRLDGANLGAEDTSAPYSIAWNTFGASNGSHTLSAIARDAAGNMATAAVLNVTVANGPAVEETIWWDLTATASAADANAWELGTVFAPTVDGNVIALRACGVTGESGDHSARLWRNGDGALLAGPHTFTYSGAGWHRFELPAPVAVTAGESYTVSVSTGTDSGCLYGYRPSDLTSAGDNGMHLTYPVSAGVYSASAGARPTSSWESANYLRDVVFVAGGPDTDGDGISDDADPDDDNDGMSDEDEQIAGTNPLDAGSSFQVSGFRVRGATAELSFDSVTGRVYGLSWNDDLTDTNGWTPVSGVVTGTGAQIQWADPDADSVSRRFYRLEVRRE